MSFAARSVDTKSHAICSFADEHGTPPLRQSLWRLRFRVARETLHFRGVVAFARNYTGRFGGDEHATTIGLVDFITSRRRFDPARQQP